MSDEKFKKTQSESEWRQQLTTEQYRVCRQKGTERPHSGQYDLHFESGVYHCVCCGEALFESDYKFDAGCGWPSFSKPQAEGKIGENGDMSQGMIRTEVICNGCGAHLGHVFPDGPAPTGLRYCINSVSMGFSPQEES